MTPNFITALNFVWKPQYDSPGQGFHATPGDPGGGTYGGVIEATWNNAVTAGIVKGTLAGAGMDQLRTVLRVKFWGVLCDALPAGLDLLMFNGRMMTGRFPYLVQQCLGFMGPDDVDGWIGPETLAKIGTRDSATLVDAISGAHASYLATLNTWPQFGHGWTERLKSAQSTALGMVHAVPVLEAT